jgi:hypothetical protein
VNAFRASLIFAVLLLLFAAVACGGKGTLPGSGTGFGGPGPWGPGNAVYGAADGIQEAPVIGISTDESQNLWVATNAALYLLKPGEKSFHRFDARDGLHLAGNPVTYCDSSFAGGDKACPITGAATAAGISEIEGGGSGEVFVGYSGDDEGNGDWSDPGRHSGTLDRARRAQTARSRSSASTSSPAPPRSSGTTAPSSGCSTITSSTRTSSTSAPTTAWTGCCPTSIARPIRASGSSTPPRTG